MKQIKIKEFFDLGLFTSLINNHRFHKIVTLDEATESGYIENNIDVEFTHRGNVITALGAEKEFSFEVLDILFNRLLNGKAVSQIEIDATLH